MFSVLQKGAPSDIVDMVALIHEPILSGDKAPKILESKSVGFAIANRYRLSAKNLGVMEGHAHKNYFSNLSRETSTNSKQFLVSTQFKNTVGVCFDENGFNYMNRTSKELFICDVNGFVFVTTEITIIEEVSINFDTDVFKLNPYEFSRFDFETNQKAMFAHV